LVVTPLGFRSRVLEPGNVERGKKAELVVNARIE
jgi:hypothetical protein